MQRVELALQLGQLFVGQVLDDQHAVAGSFQAADDLVELQVDRARIAVLRVLNKEDLKNVTMVVPVLITSCHVSEKPKAVQ